MGIRKILFVLAALFLTSVFSVSCKRAQEDPRGGTADGTNGIQAQTETQTLQETVYVPEFSKLEYMPKDNTTRALPSIFIQGERIYVILESYETAKGWTDSLVTIDIATGERTQCELAVHADSYFRTAEGFIASLDKSLVIYDEDFVWVKEIDLQSFETELWEEGKKLFCSEVTMTVGTGGECYIGILNGSYSSRELYILSEEGKPLFSIGCTPPVRFLDSLAVTGDGDMIVFTKEASIYETAYLVDMEKKELGDRLENLPKFSSVIAVCPAEEDGFYLVTESSLYLYRMRKAECRELCCFTDYGLNMASPSEYSGFGVAGEGKLAVVCGEKNYRTQETETSDVQELELALLIEKPKAEVKERTELVMAAMYAPESTMGYLEPVLEFNRYNPDYYVTIREYMKMDYGEKTTYELAKQHFVNDLITGNAADIFWIGRNDIDIGNLAEKGAVVDLYGLMDEDDEIGREDFVPGILTALEHDGKLYAVGESFYLDSLVGKQELFGRLEQWDFLTAEGLLSEHEGAVFMAGSKESVLGSLLYASMNLFYDKETGQCSFDTEEFAAVLRIVAASPEKYDYSTVVAKKLQSGEQILYSAMINAYYDIQRIEIFFNEEEPVYIGYPAQGGMGITKLRCDFRLAVSAQSEHRQGAWEFVKGYFSDDYQQNNLNFPVTQQCFEEELAREMQREGKISSSYSGVDMQLDPLTEERADILRGLIYSAAVPDFDTAIYDIVMEEAQAFFAGAKSAEEAAGLIQQRVQIYLDEIR